MRYLQSQAMYNIYIEELKDARIPYKEYPDFIWLLLEFSKKDPSFVQYKVGPSHHFCVMSIICGAECNCAKRFFAFAASVP